MAGRPESGRPAARSPVAVTGAAVTTVVRGGHRVLKKLALAALAASAVVAVRKRTTGKGEADLWAQATSGPGAVSTPRTP
jgi:hypothetical protein